jgi:hypothetical protein
MKRLLVLCLLFGLGIQTAVPALAHHDQGEKNDKRSDRNQRDDDHKRVDHRKRVVVRHYPKRTVVVHRGFPIRRTLPVVVVRPARVAIISPAIFIAPVIWVATAATAPPRERMVWKDGETLDREDGWTDFVLHCGRRGEALYLDIDGRVQINFAEVVFNNGEAVVVDFRESSRGSGICRLVDFRDRRRVDHVRMVARARSHDARIGLRLEG